MPLEKNKAGLIILGASDFPLSKNFQGDEALLCAKTRVQSYFTDHAGLGLHESYILDLFDSEDGPDDQDKEIIKFISSIKSQNIQDLFIYYVGHGSFVPKEGGFFLAIQSTRDDNVFTSSIILRSLSGTIAKKAHDIRTFLILDCCFSGAAGTVFMSDVSTAVCKQFNEDFPSKGVALLCSSSKDLPSLIIRQRNITMFTEGLELALRKGDSGIANKYLTLRQLHKLSFSFIKQLNPGEEIRPEIHSPIQPLGDIADIPHFINYAYRESSADITARANVLMERMIQNDLASAGKLFMDFVSDFDCHRKFFNKRILIGARCNQLEADKKTIDRKEYYQEKELLFDQMLTIINDLLNQPPC